MDDRPFGFWDTAKRPDKPALWCDDDGWEEGAVPDRPWLAYGYLLRGAVTIAAGVGSGGKSSLMCAWAISCALGAAYGRFEPIGPLKVLTYNVEDDSNEQKRRLSAALRQFGRTPQDLAGKVIRCGPTGIGTLIERGPDGAIYLTAAWDALVRLIEERLPDVVILDPFAELHTADENDNSALRQVVARLRDLAAQHDLAVVLVHHTRKGAMAGDMDSIRGAGGLVYAARIALTVSPMSAEEADDLGISRDLRRSFFRVDNPKSNYGPAGEAAWHEIVPIDLDNGETVAAAMPWTPPGMEGKAMRIDPATVALIAAEAARGLPGGAYSPRLSQAEPRSILSAMLRHGISDAQAQRLVVDRMMAEGWTVEEYEDAKSRRKRGLRSPGRLPAVDWTDNHAVRKGGEE